MSTREEAESRGWVFDESQYPAQATLGHGNHPQRVVRHGGDLTETLRAVDGWESHQAARKPESRHPLYVGDEVSE